MSRAMDFTLKITMVGAAFVEDPKEELSRILHKYADRLPAAFDPDSRVALLDANRNTVGEMRYVERDVD